MRSRLSFLACAASLLFAAPAGADVYKASLGAAKPTYAWSGHGVGLPGFECSNEVAFRCDSVIFTLEVAGDLTMSIDVEGEQISNPAGAAAYPNFDLYLFASDADGSKQGDAVAEATTPIDDETLVAPALAAGHYVLEVRSDESVGEDYAGKARLSNFALPPAVAPAPATEPAPAKPKRSARSRCRAKARKIDNRRKRARALRRCRKRAG